MNLNVQAMFNVPSLFFNIQGIKKYQFVHYISHKKFGTLGTLPYVVNQAEKALANLNCYNNIKK